MIDHLIATEKYDITRAVDQIQDMMRGRSLLVFFDEPPHHGSWRLLDLNIIWYITCCGFFILLTFCEKRYIGASYC